MHIATMRYSHILAAMALASCATHRVEQVAQDTDLITISTPVEQNRTAAELAVSARRMDEVRRESNRRSQEYCARQQGRAVEMDGMMSIQSRGDPEGEINILDAEWDAVLTMTFRCE